MRPFNRRSLVSTIVASLALMGCAGPPATDGVTREFVAVTTTGDEISGESMQGRVTIIDFWAVF